LVTAGSALNPALTGIAGILTNTLGTGTVWMTPNGSPSNHKVYDGYYPIHGLGAGSTPVPAAFLSHMDLDFWSYLRGGQFSPGYQPKYVMGPFIFKQVKRRVYTLAEHRYLNQLGYLYATTFASATNLSTLGNVQNALLLNNNVAPFRSNYTFSVIYG
jgi:hypothetical protein